MGTKTVSQKTMATTVEAILGAVYKDGGDHALDTVLLALNVTHPFLEAVTLTLNPAFLSVPEKSFLLDSLSALTEILRPDVKGLRVPLWT